MIDSKLSWNQQIGHLIKKLNSRVHLLRRVKSYLTIVCRKLLYNSLIKSILEYCCTVVGNCSKGNLDRLLKLQKRCARIILDANTTANSVNLFNGLEWLPIDDITKTNKLLLLYKISRGICPQYFESYFTYVNTVQKYSTRSANNKLNIITPKCKNNSGLRTFHSSACRQWNKTDLSIKNIASYANFRKVIHSSFQEQYCSIEHFCMEKTY